MSLIRVAGGMRSSDYYFTTPGVERIRAAGLTGFEFVPIWAPN